MKNILVTGATGFIGACLVEDLVKENYNVSIIVRKESNIWRLNKVINKIKIYYCDIVNKDELESIAHKINPEYIFHLATYGAYYFQQDDDLIINTNLIGTKNLVEAFTKVNYKAFVNIGSSSEYGIKNECMKENDFIEPINIYGVSKAAQTLYCNMIYKTQNKPIGTVRFFSVYGNYEDKTRLVPSVILACLKGENPKLANGEAVRDFIYIKDVIEFLKFIAFKEKIGGKIYNLGSGSQCSVKQMVQTIIKESGTVVNPMWGKLEGRKSDATQKWEADMSLVKKELNWIPKYDLNKGIKQSIEWFKNNMELYDYF
ncbi:MULTISPECIES: NAD-dependent epimerase/dehydratase family protein [Clostridium]|uniref:NAD-dependent epimerase/dehydratase family protein n=1 Tax=Clostridium TaxID=1485 RepID=UPI00058638F2|nr:NAD-dependent epimerase/dehydratase family protein [Clostridium sporogenes]AJD31945.1 3-beta hydroxysteroid dehydrogenase/isomerase family protein [Clostridium botulinum Prevot_594]